VLVIVNGLFAMSELALVRRGAPLA